MKCCICNKEFKGYGNNPEGACWKDEKGNIVEGKFKKTDRCCNSCDNIYVTTGRIYLLQKMRKDEGR